MSVSSADRNFLKFQHNLSVSERSADVIRCIHKRARQSLSVLQQKVWGRDNFVGVNVYFEEDY